MNIDFQKLAQLLIPTFLRKTFLIELIAPLMSPLQIMHSQFNLWFEEARYKANTNASVISLTHIIQREFDVIATIEELDGKPTDFMVTVSGTVDEVRLRTLINQYKIAGRSFTFRIGSVAYVCGFSNHVCEDIIELNSVAFIEHVCEDTREVYITAIIWQYSIVFTASRQVKSDITIAGNIIGHGGNGVSFTGSSFNVVILANAAVGSDSISTDQANIYTLDKSLISISPASDAYFNYILL